MYIAATSTPRKPRRNDNMKDEHNQTGQRLHARDAAPVRKIPVEQTHASPAQQTNEGTAGTGEETRTIHDHAVELGRLGGLATARKRRAAMQGGAQ